MKDKKVVFMGTPEFSVPVLDALIENTNVIGVVTQPDKESGRKQEVTISPVKKLAQENNIKVLQPVKIRKEYREIIDLNPDIIVTCAYGQIIPKELLDAPRLGCINVHASLLPKLRGGAPIHRAIMNGFDKTGITIMYMDEHMDTGDIISTKEINIDVDMTTGELHDRLSILGKELLLETLPEIINGTNNRTKQIDEESTYAKLIKREDEYIDFNQNTNIIHNQIRGLSPFPGAYTTMNGKIMKVYKSKLIDLNKTDIPGKIVSLSKEGINVSTKDGIIAITDIKVEGRKRMSAKEYLNGVSQTELIGITLGNGKCE